MRSVRSPMKVEAIAAHRDRINIASGVSFGRVYQGRYYRESRAKKSLRVRTYLERLILKL